MSTFLFLLIFVVCIFLQAERGVPDLFSYLRLFRLLKQGHGTPKVHPPERQLLFVLIPVLREQAIIEDTLLRFCAIETPHFEVTLAIITSVRETSNNANADYRTTEELLENSLTSGRLSQHKARIRIFRDPEASGNMATQLNYALQRIHSIAAGHTLFLVYNADSRISGTTFQALAELIERFPEKQFACQQPCAFVRDMNPNANAFTNALSLYQSWYCLGHESRQIWNYQAALTFQAREILLTKLGVIVGHGSGMTLRTNFSNHGYPSELLTEDLTFGFILSANNVPIVLLPALEIADVPNHFLTFIKQKSVWFWNFLSYPHCYHKMRRLGHSPIRLLSLLLQGVAAGAYWFFDTFFIITPFIISVYLESFCLSLIAFVSVFIFHILPQYVLLRQLPNVLRAQGFTDIADNVEHVSFIKLLPSLCLIILTNSVGAWIASLKAVQSVFSGRLPTKYKTGD